MFCGYQSINNTFYIKEGLNNIWHTSHGNAGPINLENNIFYFAGETPATVENWNPNGNKVSDIPDIGAHETGTVSLTISSDRFAIDQAKKEITIDTVDKVTAKDLLDSLMTEDGVTVELKRGSSTLTGGVKLAKGDTLAVSCNGESVAYTVVTVTSEVTDEIPVADMTATAGSEETAQDNNGVKNVLDNNLGTIWHTSWNGSNPEDRYVTIELANDYEVSGYMYTPRQDGSGDGASNGTITKYTIYTSNDNKTWEEVASGSWAQDKEVKTVTFEKPVKAKYIKLLAVESVRDFATAAPVAPTVTATDVTDTTAKISWLPAEADKDIVEYQLMNGDKEIATFDATEEHTHMG